MKSAMLISEDGRLMTEVAEALQALGARVSDGVGGRTINWQDRDGRLTRIESAFVDGDWRDYPDEEPPAIENGVAPPNLSAVSGCIVECRWDDWFIATMKLLAEALPFPLWVIDTDGVLWAADSIDPGRLVL